MPLISVVIPAHNAASFVAETLCSLVKQTFRDFEVVLVDDGSADGTAEISHRFSDDLALRVLVNAQNSGVAASINRGIAESDSLYIARLDADDLAHPDRLRQQLAFLEASPDIDLCGTHMRMFKDGDATHTSVHEHPTSDAAIKTMLLQHNALSHPSVLMRRQFMSDVGQYDPACDYAEDYDLWCRGALMGKRYANMPVHLTSYRVHSGQVGQIKSKLQCERDLAVKTRYMSALLGGMTPGYLPALFSPLVQ
ncbi:MAG: glycosyltransferase family 2 protein, partial [Rhodoferax sp.]|nr:glycosyltransferase family 2 protein [Rhodoferax sp.]